MRRAGFFFVTRSPAAPCFYVLLAGGSIAGLGLAFAATKLAAMAIEASTGLHLSVTIGASDLLFVLTLIGWVVCWA